MFEIQQSYRIDTLIPIITDNYQILHFDEFPILFSGTNKYNNKIIGSFCDEHDDSNIFRYFASLVPDEVYFDFFARRISYRELIAVSNEFFVLDKDFNQKVISTYHLPLSAIPEEYLPHPNAFIPDHKVVLNESSYVFSLKGKLSDLHKSLVTDVNSVSKRISHYLDDCLESLPPMNFSPRILSLPSNVGSYRLNFLVELQETIQGNLFPVNERKVFEFLSHYIYYVTTVLPNEGDAFLLGSGTSAEFDELKGHLVSVYKAANLAVPNTLYDKLSDSLSSSAGRLAEVSDYLDNNESFNGIEVGVTNHNGGLSSIAFLNSKYREDVEDKLMQEDKDSDLKVIESDETPTKYRILVYRFNTDNGNGGARLYFDDNSEDFDRVKIIVEKGDKEFSKSKFTDSLHENKVVEVQGIALRVNGTYKKLDCYEQ
jgi:hypothetical protein